MKEYSIALLEIDKSIVTLREEYDENEQVDKIIKL